MKMHLTATVLAVKTDGSPKANFVTVVQKGAGNQADQADLIFPKDCGLPNVGDEISVYVSVKATTREYRGKQYPKLSCFYNPPKEMNAAQLHGQDR